MKEDRCARLPRDQDLRNGAGVVAPGVRVFAFGWFEVVGV